MERSLLYSGYSSIGIGGRSNSGYGELGCQVILNIVKFVVPDGTIIESIMNAIGPYKVNPPVSFPAVMAQPGSVLNPINSIGGSESPLSLVLSEGLIRPAVDVVAYEYVVLVSM